MAKLESIVEGRLGGAAVSRDLVEACHIEEAEGAACERLMWIALVADIENELIVGGIENAVHGNCGLDDAEIGAYVAAVDRAAIEDSLPDLVGERGKECGIESLDIGGGIDIFE